MKITAIRIRILNNTGNKMVGLVSLTLEDMIAIHDIKILKTQSELFLAMPSRSTKSGTFKDIVHPINALVRDTIEKIVFSAYNLCLKENVGNAQFDLISGYNGVLTEQTIDNFVLVSLSEHLDSMPNDQYSKTITKPKKNESNRTIGEDLSKWLEG